MKGFTLIETLIYISLMSLLLTGALASTYVIARSNTRTSIMAHLEHEGMFIERTIIRTLQEGAVIEPSQHESSKRIRVQHKTDGILSIEATSGLLTMEDDIDSTIVSDFTLPQGLMVMRGGSVRSSINPEYISFAFDLSATSSDGALVTRHFKRTVYLFAP